MLVVTLCQTKGGSGKSTLAECFAVHASRNCRVTLLDLDPQASTTKWWRRRGGPDNPLLATDIKTLSVFIASLKRGVEPDVLIIDTPGSMLGTIRDAVQEADVVVVPLSPSVKDWEAMDVVESIVHKAGKQKQTMHIVNRFRPGTDASVEALRALKERSLNPPVAVSLRTDHEKADAAGQTAPEINKEAAREIAAAWDQIERIRNVE